MSDLDCPLRWGTVADWFVGAATFGAVLVALFGEKMRSAIFPPKIVVGIQSPKGTPAKFAIKSPDGTIRLEDARYFHLKVSVVKRWPTASDVQVFLTRFEQHNAAGEYTERWLGNIPVRWENQEVNPIARRIGPSVNADMCSVVKGKWLEIHPLIVPNDLTTRWRSDDVIARNGVRMALTFMAKSIEADSDPIRVEIAWDGHWSDDSDQMAQHLSVKHLI